MAFRVKNRSMSGMVRFRVKTQSMIGTVLFHDQFDIHVPVGSSKLGVVRLSLKTLNKTKSSFSFDFDGRKILVTMKSEPGWMTIERIQDN